MKKIALITLLLIFAGFELVIAQSNYVPQNLFKVEDKDGGDNIQIDISSVTVKDNEGKKIDIPQFVQMANSQKYDMDAYADKDGTIKELVLRPKSAGEQGANNNATTNNLQAELENIRMKDQLLRTLIIPGGCIFDTYGTNSGEYAYFALLMKQEDKKNQDRVCEIIDEHGWLGISEIGQLANSTLFLVIQHSPLEVQEKYFPLLKTSAEKGESKSANMALMDDRIRMYKKQKQLYGSQTITKNGKLYVAPIEDPSNVDERRKSVGLQPLADYLKLMSLSYPQDEIPMELFVN